MDLILIVLTSAPHNQINSDKAASGKSSKPVPIIVVALLWSIFNTVVKRSCLHQSQTSTPTLCSQFSSGFLPHTLNNSQVASYLILLLTHSSPSHLDIAYNVLHYLHPSPLIFTTEYFYLNPFVV